MEGGPHQYIYPTFIIPGRVVWQSMFLLLLVDPGGSEDAGATLYKLCLSRVWL